MVALRKQSCQKGNDSRSQTDPAPLLKASKDEMTAEVDYVEVDLAYREAYVKLMALTGKQ
jgi:hypothetical protein